MKLLFTICLLLPIAVYAFFLVRRFLKSLINLNQAKAVNTIKAKQTYWVGGYCFPSYYIAKAWAKDNGYDATDIKIMKGDNNG